VECRGAGTGKLSTKAEDEEEEEEEEEDAFP